MVALPLAPICWRRLMAWSRGRLPTVVPVPGTVTARFLAVSGSPNAIASCASPPGPAGFQASSLAGSPNACWDWVLACASLSAACLVFSSLFAASWRSSSSAANALSLVLRRSCWVALAGRPSSAALAAIRLSRSLTCWSNRLSSSLRRFSLASLSTSEGSPRNWPSCWNWVSCNCFCCSGVSESHHLATSCGEEPISGIVTPDSEVASPPGVDDRVVRPLPGDLAASP